MSLILAIEPDRRQASKVRTLADALGVDLVIGETTEEALQALGARIPDLVLTSQLLLPKDEGALADRLRELDAAGAHAPTLVIPVLRSEEREGKKKSSGLFGRLRRAPQEDTGEGCDPAVFGREITEYLERGAAERAALAAAQADLEAAWAEEPAPVAAPPANVKPEPHAVPEPTADGASAWLQPERTAAIVDIDVHPGMVIDDPQALFGEFAAIPIRRPGPEPADAEDLTTIVEALAPSAPDHQVLTRREADEDDLPPPTPRLPARPPDEEWEEISLDVVEHTLAPHHATDARPAAHDVEIPDASLDLDAFVRELETVKSSANAQPMIPVVDLSHVIAGDIDLPEPMVVPEEQIHAEARATFEAEVAGVFATAPRPIDDPEPETGEATPAWTVPVMEPPAAVVPPVWTEPQEAWRADLDSLPSPPEPVSLEPPPAPKAPVFKPAWGDLLSAIQRDIEQTRTTDDATVSVVKPKPDFTMEPLVFPSRPGVSPSVVAAIESGSAERVRTEPAPEVRPTSDVVQPEIALAALLHEVTVSDRRDAEGPAPEARLDTPPAESPGACAPDETLPCRLDAPSAEAEPILEFAVETASPVFEPAPALESADVVEPLSPILEPSVDEHAFASATLAEPAPPPAPPLDALAWLVAAPAPPCAVDEPAGDESLDALFAAQAFTTHPHADRGASEDTAATLPLAGEPEPVAELAATAMTPPLEPALPPETPVPVLTGTPRVVPRHERPQKSKKKRKVGYEQELVATVASAPGASDWGFFDPQTTGFGPLLARLDQLHGGRDAPPLR